MSKQKPSHTPDHAAPGRRLGQALLAYRYRSTVQSFSVHPQLLGPSLGKRSGVAESKPSSPNSGGGWMWASRLVEWICFRGKQMVLRWSARVLGSFNTI